MLLKSAWKQSFPAIILCLLLSFVGGTFLGAYFEVLVEKYPIVLIVLPGIMGLRGNIFGSLASRFSTSLYLGEIPPKVFSKGVFEGVSLSLLLALIPVVILWLIGVFKIKTLDVTVAILFASTTLACLILAFSTALVTIIPFRKGVDPDAIAAPLVTSIADLVTIPTLIVFIILAEKNVLVLTISSITLFLTLLYFIKKYRFKVRVYTELGAILCFLALLSSVSGILLESFSGLIYEIFVLSVLYPALLDSLGNYGSVVGAKISTKLHLGEIDKLFDKRVFNEIFSLMSTSPIIPILMYLIAFPIVLTLGKNVEITFLFFLLYPVFAFLSMLIAAAIAVLSFRTGLDPDNVTVPMITTLADVIATVFAVFIAFLSLNKI